MKITYITHACLFIKVGKINIITDPWLIGPSWGGTLWHYPENKFLPKNLPVPDIIYFSHGHDDHFHENSINNFPSSWLKAQIIAPNYKEKWWKSGLALKFKKIKYLNHNQIIKINHNLKIQIFLNDQGEIDSSLKIIYNNTTCFLQTDNLLSIKEALRISKLGKIDIAFVMPYLTGIFPAFYKWTKKEMIKLAQIKKGNSINYSSNIINKLKPKLVVPYAVDLATLGKNFYANFIHNNNKKDFLSYLKKKNPNRKGIILNPGNFLEFSNGDLIKDKVTKYKFSKNEFYNLKKKYALKFKNFETNDKKFENQKKIPIIFSFIKTLEKNLKINNNFNFNVLFQIKDNNNKNYKFLINFKNKKIIKQDKIPKLFLPKLIIFTEFYKIANLVNKKYPMNFMTFHNGAIRCQRKSFKLSLEEKKFWKWIYNLSF